MTDLFVGQDLARREDPALLTGEATYTDDITVDGMAFAAILRSQYGHATVESIDTAAAEALGNVVAVFTASDVAVSDSPGILLRPSHLPNCFATPQPLLTDEIVRYVGEALAIVIAEDRYTAHNALDEIQIDYDRKNAVVDARAALSEGAPTVHDGAPDNLAFDLTFGDTETVEAAFDIADTTAHVKLRNQRLIGDPIEPRAVIAEPDENGLLVTMATQVPHRANSMLADVLGLEPNQVEVVSPAVGGGFGIKGGQYTDEALVAWCALQLERPVKWVETRSEGHATDYHSRDFYLDGALALDADGTMRGLWLDGLSNVGAYYVFPPSLFGNFEHIISGQYAIPAIAYRARGAFTNTTPTAAYRGAGRPEAIFFLERLVREAANELGMDPTVLRRINQIPPDMFPFETALGTVYDSGDYEATMDIALEAVSYEAMRRRQSDLREEDRYLGIGLSCFVENTGASPGSGETSRVRVSSDGTVTAYLGTHDHGQGHRTTFAQVLADELELDFDDIEIVEGDTRDVPNGTGTFGSRSAGIGGAAMVEAANEMLEQAREAAANRLESDVSDINYAEGSFHVAGAPDRAISLGRLFIDTELEATVTYNSPNYGFSFGTHVAVVEVDPETGEIEFERYVAVDDCGVVINPRIVAGQIHGGVTQGLGQALTENAVYDQSGSLLSGSLQDYAIPKSTQVPEYETYETQTPSPHNPLGVKGIGESGTIAATPAIVNAVVDALEPFDVTNIDLPMTPEAVWRAITYSDQ